MPPTDPAQAYLGPLQLDSNTKADAWDAFHGAQSNDDFVGRLKKLNLSDDQRADLWDLKFGGGLKPRQQAAPAVPQASPQVPPIQPQTPASPGFPKTKNRNTPSNQQFQAWKTKGWDTVSTPVGAVLDTAQKYLVDPFEYLAKKGSDIGGSLAQSAVGGYGQDPNNSLPQQTPEEFNKQFETQAPVLAGVTKGIGSAVGSTVADPRNWPFFFQSAARPAMQRLVSRGFAAQMTAGTVQQAGQLHEQWSQLSDADKAADVTSTGLTAMLAAHTALHSGTTDRNLPASKPFSVDTTRPGEATSNPSYLRNVAEPRQGDVQPTASPEIPVSPKQGGMASKGPEAPLRQQARDLLAEYRSRKQAQEPATTAEQAVANAAPKESQNGAVPTTEPAPIKVQRRPPLQQRLQELNAKVDTSLDPAIQDRQRKVAQLEDALDKATHPDEIDSLLGIVNHEKRKLAAEVASGKPLNEPAPLEIAKPQLPSEEDTNAKTTALDTQRRAMQDKLASVQAEHDQIDAKLKRHQAAVAKGGGQYQLPDNQVDFLQAEKARRLRDMTSLARKINDNYSEGGRVQRAAEGVDLRGRPSKVTPTPDVSPAAMAARAAEGGNYIQRTYGIPTASPLEMGLGPSSGRGSGVGSKPASVPKPAPEPTITPRRALTPEEESQRWAETPEDIKQRIVTQDAEGKWVQAGPSGQPKPAELPKGEWYQEDGKWKFKESTTNPKTPPEVANAKTKEPAAPAAVPGAPRSREAAEVSSVPAKAAPATQTSDEIRAAQADAKVYEKSLALAGHQEAVGPIKNFIDTRSDLDEAGRVQLYTKALKTYVTELLKNNPSGALQEAHRVALARSAGAVPTSLSSRVFSALDQAPMMARSFIARYFPTTLRESLAMTPEKATQVVRNHVDPTLVKAAQALDTKVISATAPELREQYGLWATDSEMTSPGNFKRLSAVAIQAQGTIERIYRNFLGSMRMNDVFAHEIGHEVWDRIRTNAKDLARSTMIERFYPDAVETQRRLYGNEIFKAGTAKRAEEVFAESFSHWYRGLAGDTEGFENLMKKAAPDVYDKIAHLRGQGKIFEHMPQPTPDAANKAIEDWKTFNGDAPYDMSAGAKPQVPVTDPDLKTIHDAQEEAKGGRVSFMERIAMLPKEAITKLHDKFNFMPGAHGPANIISTEGVNLSQRAIEKRIGRPLSNEENPYVQFRLMDGGGAGPATSFGIKMGDIMHDAEKAGLLHKTQEVLNLHGYNRAISVIEEKRAQASQEYANHKAQHDALSQAIASGKLTVSQGEAALASARHGMNRAHDEYKQHDDTLNNKEAVPLGLDKPAIQQKLQDIQTQLGPADYQKVSDFARRVWDLNATTWKSLHLSGVISDEMYNKGVARGPEYIPMNRILDVVKDSPNNGGRAFDLKTENIIHELLGSDKINKNPFDASMGHISLAFQEIQRNIAARQLADFRHVDPQGWGTLIRDLGPTEKPRKGEGILGYYDKGEPVRFAIPEDLAQVIRNSHPQDVSMLGQALSAFSRNYRRLLTVANLSYTLPRFIRDITEYQTLSHASKGPLGFAKNLFYDYPKAVKEVIDRSPDFHEALQNRALGGTFQSQVSPDMWQDHSGIFGNLIRGNPLKAIEHFNAYAENAAKLMSWKDLKRQGASPTENAWETRNMAGTPDFAQTGTMSKEANLLWMFINADIKANTRTFHRLVSEPRRLMLLAATSAGVALAAYRHNSQFTDEDGKPELDHVSDNDKRNYFIIITPEKYQTSQGAIRNRIVKVYKPPLYRQIYNPIADVIEQSGRGKWDFEQTGLNFLSSVLPGQFYLKKGNVAGTAGQGVLSSLNPVIREPIEQANNQDAYTGAPIVPRSLQDVEPPDKTTPLTSPVVQGAARAIYKAAPEINKVPVVGPMLTEPARLQHALTNSTGGMGEMGISAADTAYNLVKGKPLQSTNTGLPLQGDEKVASTPVVGPVLRRFVGSRQDQIEKNLEQNFYDYAGKVRAFQNSFDLKAKADPEGLREALKDPRTAKLLSTMEDVSDMEKQLSELRDAQLAIQRSKTTNAESRARAMHALYKSRIQILKVFDENIRPQLETLR